MGASSGENRSAKWDVRHLPPGEGRAADVLYAETYASRLLGLALTHTPEFAEHVQSCRNGELEQVARRHLRRAQGRRPELLETYWSAAAAAAPSRNEHLARMAVWNLVPLSWWVGAPYNDPAGPKRLRDSDAVGEAAIRVARRGAGRCAHPSCCYDPILKREVGALLAADSAGDYCSAHAAMHPHPRTDVEAERMLFDRACAVVLRATSRAERRRAA